MSNHLAIATVTATLGSLLARATGVVSGAEVSTLRPGTLGPNMPDVGINLYLYEAASNPSWRNNDLPTRDSGGHLAQRPTAALDLHYLLSFQGDETTLEPQRLMGAAVATLHASPVLSREAIRRVIEAAVAGDPNHYLGRSNLADQIEVVRLAPLGLGLEDMSKLWSVFFQAPYMLSLAYQASVVLIEEELPAQRALPVRSRNLVALPLSLPRIEHLVAQSGEGDFILAGSPVYIQGQRLKGAVTRVLFGDSEVVPDPDLVGDTQISLALPAGLKAGVLGAQVAHLLLLGGGEGGLPPGTLHRGSLSNMAPFVLHPQIKQPGGVYDITFTERAAAPDGTLAGKISVKLAPDVGKDQRVELLLNEAQPAGRPESYRFPATRRTADGDTVEFPILGVTPHTYLVRVQVDGAESPLDMDTVEANPTFGMYIGPTVDIV